MKAFTDMEKKDEIIEPDRTFEIERERLGALYDKYYALFTQHCTGINNIQIHNAVVRVLELRDEFLNAKGKDER